MLGVFLDTLYFFHAIAAKKIITMLGETVYHVHMVSFHMKEVILVVSVNTTVVFAIPPLVYANIIHTLMEIFVFHVHQTV